MPERCPLLDSPFGIPFIDRDIPEVCIENCESLWDKALNEGKQVSQYDTYPNFSPENCTHEGTISYGHDSLVAVSLNLRLYTVTDYCDECTLEYGEKSYGSQCLNV